MLIETIIDNAAYYRSSSPTLIKRGLSLQQTLSLFEMIYAEVTNYQPIYVEKFDRWAVSEHVHQVALNKVNPNLILNSTIAFTGLQAPFDYPGQYVPLKAYGPGILSIALPDTLANGTYSFSLDLGHVVAESDIPGYLIYDEGSYDVDYWGPDIDNTFLDEGPLTVALRYPATDLPVALDYTRGQMKLHAVFQHYGTIAPSFIEVQIQDKLIAGGFKLELGHIATPSRVGAQQDLEPLIPFQIGEVQIDTAGINQQGVILSGDFPREFQVTHRAARVVPALNTDLGAVDTELQMALQFGLAHAIDMATLEGSKTYQMDHREKRYQYYKSRVQNRDFFQKAEMRRGLKIWHT